MERARNVAAPINMHSFTGQGYPLSKDRKMRQLPGDDCICGQVVVTRLSMIPARIKVVLVNDDLGF